jgi:predicted amidohydrolase YtcJ
MKASHLLLLVVLSDDILTLAPGQIEKAEDSCTIVGGKIDIEKGK